MRTEIELKQHRHDKPRNKSWRRRHMLPPTKSLEETMPLAVVKMEGIWGQIPLWRKSPVDLDVYLCNIMASGPCFSLSKEEVRSARQGFRVSDSVF
jgi:hypothetical protein